MIESRMMAFLAASVVLLTGEHYVGMMGERGIDKDIKYYLHN